MAFAFVPASRVAAGLKASEWVGAAIAAAGGKAGGKDDSAMGTAVGDATHVPAVLAAAAAFASSKPL